MLLFYTSQFKMCAYINYSVIIKPRKTVLLWSTGEVMALQLLNTSLPKIFLAVRLKKSRKEFLLSRSDSRTYPPYAFEVIKRFGFAKFDMFLPKLDLFYDTIIDLKESHFGVDYGDAALFIKLQYTLDNPASDDPDFWFIRIFPFSNNFLVHNPLIRVPPSNSDLKTARNCQTIKAILRKTPDLKVSR